MGYPEACDICVKERVKEKIKARLFEGDVELSVKPFKGSKPKIVLVGLNPTLSDRKVEYVLELDNKNSSIYKFIVDEILKPVGLKLDHIYATNLVKCTFPDNHEPGRICRNEKATKEFLFSLFRYCRKHFETEVHEIKPKILILLGKIPHQLLVEAFNLDEQGFEKEMKKSFSHIYHIDLLGHEIFYAPCIRKKAEGHQYLKNLFPIFLKNLRKFVISTGIV
jgi:uracil-DNA glycosylase family 4